jgi:hypothetical protein
LSAIYTIAQKSYESIGIEEYEKIPENDRKLFDLKLTGVNYNLKGNTYTIDLGINQIEVDYPNHNSFWYSSRILDQGDLSTYYGYETLEASGYTIKQAKAYPKTFNTIDEVKALKFKDILKQGYGFVRMVKIPASTINSPFPVHLVGPTYKVPELNLEPGINPTFFLEKAGVVEYAVINGFLINLGENTISIPNAMTYK